MVYNYFPRQGSGGFSGNFAATIQRLSGAGFVIGTEMGRAWGNGCGSIDSLASSR
jgi:hypothetical protein